MRFSIKLHTSHLKIISSILTNIASGLLILPFTTRDPTMLTMSFVLAIVCIGFVIKVENFLEEL